MHGRNIRNMDRLVIGREDTLLWLLRGDLKGENGGQITAAQDVAVPNKNHATKILQTERESKCRL
jgi:hypothetical protein